MFGAVTAGQIADELHRHFEISLDRKKIHVDHHGLRSLGDHEVEMRLHPEVKATLKVRVESLNPPPVPPAVEAPKAEDAKPARGGKARAERAEKKGA
jgi:large subunit ribosomal protein L9